MISISKNLTILLLISHLIILEGNAYGVTPTECGAVDFNSGAIKVTELSLDVNKINQQSLENEIGQEVKTFYKMLEKEIRDNPNTSYSPPKVNINGFSNKQNQMLNDFIKYNGKIIKNKKLYNSNEIPVEIYNTPSLIAKKYHLSLDHVNKVYQSQLANVEPMGMGIFKVTSGVSVGTIIGLMIAFAPNDIDKDKD